MFIIESLSGEEYMLSYMATPLRAAQHRTAGVSLLVWRAAHRSVIAMAAHEWLAD